MEKNIKEVRNIGKIKVLYFSQKYWRKQMVFFIYSPNLSRITCWKPYNHRMLQFSTIHCFVMVFYRVIK